MSEDISEPGEGNSPAAWTAVIIMLLAFTIGTIAFFFDQPVIVWASVGLLVVGLIVGKVMSSLGYGVSGSKLTPKEH
ncbi:MAG TPA: DUF6704 family protein [Lacisediminihabitans sp.]|uniref:DUF6704 family protein n=1 Tax=Lacisediminihabitans sp. TaxID=2787631 RepID=UPI002EDAB680